MDEIDGSLGVNSLQHRRRAPDRNRIPTHMWDFQSGNMRRGQWEPFDRTLYDIQASMGAELLALREQKLKAKADPQERFPVLDRPLNRIDQAKSSEVGHAIPKGTDAR